jgi:hypothetical protein
MPLRNIYKVGELQLNMKDQQTLRKYLLGNMPVEGQEQVELWLMSDDQAYDLLEAAEDDLIDDFLQGELRGPDLDQFQNHFLVAPERKNKLQFSCSLHRFIRSRSLFERASFWTAVRASLQFRRAPAYAVAALLALLLVGGIWTAERDILLQRRPDSAMNQLADTRRQRDEPQKQLQEAQTATQNLEQQVRALEETVARPKSGSTSPALLAVNLIPNLTRATSDIPAVAVTGDTQFVQFSLALLDDNYSSYRVSLRDAGGKEIWRKDGLTSMAAPGGKAIVVLIPATLLVPADYTFTLSGISSSQAPPEDINTFPFPVVRRPS